MTRQPKCYQTDENEWVSTLGRRSGNSVYVTVPKGVMKSMCLRPGILVRVHISRMAPRPEEDETEERGSARDPSEVPSITEGKE